MFQEDKNKMLDYISTMIETVDTKTEQRFWRVFHQLVSITSNLDQLHLIKFGMDYTDDIWQD